MKSLTVICLAFIGGFVDTATFIGANGIFAAHITGNFVLFGVAVSQGLQLQDYINLLVFPTFILPWPLNVGIIMQYKLLVV